MVGVTGASGAPIALRTLRALHAAHVPVALVVSRGAVPVLREECGVGPSELRAFARDTYEDDDGRVFIESLRTIRPGEELTYDYMLNYDGHVGPRVRARYRCRCGAPSCRGSMLAPTRRR